MKKKLKRKNRAMADCVVVFWDGVSRGTKYKIDKAREKNVITAVYNVVN